MRVILALFILMSCAGQKKLSNPSELKIYKRKGFLFLKLKTEGAPIFCSLYTVPVSFTSTFENFIKNSMKDKDRFELGSLKSKISENGSPYFSLNYVYVKNIKAGAFKAIAVDMNTSPAYCFQDQVSSQDEFEKVVIKTIEPFEKEIGKMDKAVYYKEINGIKIGGRDVGFSQKLKIKNAKGTKVIENIHMLVPRSKTDLLATDTYTTQHYDKDNILLQGNYLNTEGQKTKHKISLKREDLLLYKSSGSFMGEEFSNKEITLKKPLQNYDFELESKALKLKDGESVQSNTYSPGVDPLSSISLTMKRIKETKDGMIEFEVMSESVVSQVKMRKDGVSPYTKSQMGNITMETILKYEYRRP